MTNSKKSLGRIDVIGKHVYLEGYETPWRTGASTVMHAPSLRLVAAFEIGSSSLCYYADAKRVYIHAPGGYPECIEGAQPDDFRVLAPKNRYASQSQGKFFYGTKQIDYDPTDVELLGGYFVRTDMRVFFHFTRELVDVDLASFEVLHPDLVQVMAKDASRVFFRDVPIAAADATSFRFLGDCVRDDRPYYLNCDVNFYAIDKLRAYWICTAADEVVPIRSRQLDRFEFFVDVDRQNRGFARDGEYEYNAGKRRPLRKSD